MARQFRQQRQWTLPGGTAPRAERYQGLVFRRTILRLRAALLRLDGQYGTGAVITESFRLLVCHARQRLHRVGAARGEAAACTCLPTSSSAVRKVGG
jgi:hypothetical protein